MKKVCDTCRFWFSGVLHYPTGDCRCECPSVLADADTLKPVTVWPQTMAKAFCGEWISATELAAQAFAFDLPSHCHPVFDDLTERVEKLEKKGGQKAESGSWLDEAFLKLYSAKWEQRIDVLEKAHDALQERMAMHEQKWEKGSSKWEFRPVADLPPGVDGLEVTGVIIDEIHTDEIGELKAALASAADKATLDRTSARITGLQRDAFRDALATSQQHLRQSNKANAVMQRQLEQLARVVQVTREQDGLICSDLIEGILNGERSEESAGDGRGGKPAGQEGLAREAQTGGASEGSRGQSEEGQPHVEGEGEAAPAQAPDEQGAVDRPRDTGPGDPPEAAGDGAAEPEVESRLQGILARASIGSAAFTEMFKILNRALNHGRRYPVGIDEEAGREELKTELHEAFRYIIHGDEKGSP